MPIVRVPLFDLDWEVARSVRGEIPSKIQKAYIDTPADQFPPPVAFQDESGKIVLGEGFLRWQGAYYREEQELAVDLRPGTRKDALLYALQSNVQHGLPRTRADKRECVEKLLIDEAYDEMSDEWFAQACNVSRTFVARVRKKFAGTRAQRIEARLGMDGRVRRLPKPPPPGAPPEPELSPRDRAIGFLRKAKSETHSAIDDTEEAERLLRDGSTRPSWRALKATLRELDFWQRNLENLPPIPPVPDPNDQSEEGRVKAELYRIARLSEEEILNMARKMLSHDKAQLMGAERAARSSRGSQPETLQPGHQGAGQPETLPAGRQPETLHPSDRGRAASSRPRRASTRPRSPPDD